jgi:superfamily II DNA or RNA helicase
MITIEKIDEVYLKIRCEPSYARELSQFFTFKVPNHQYSPAFKKKKWDGTIKLFNLASQTIFVGLLDYVIKFCEDRSYKYEVLNVSNISLDESYIKTWLSEQKIYSNGKQILPHSYQIEAAVEAIKRNRILLLSPTGSGKSLIIYLILKFLLEHNIDTKYLIVVPTTGLVYQMSNDFIDYSNKDKNLARQIHLIFQGKEKTSKKRIIISTWQSIFKEHPDYFLDFHGVFGDECHLHKAKSLSSLMKKCKNSKFRVGTTGTLDNVNAHKLIIEGLFGRCYSVTTTKELMDDKVLSELTINTILLSYDPAETATVKKVSYQQEMEWIVTNKKRNEFICNLANNISGNVLVLFNYVDKHGIPLYETLKSQNKKDVFMIYGKTDVEQRENIRNVVDNHSNSVLVASYGTCSTGINIKNINAIIFASPSKSVIRILQSIGRGLRKSNRKDSATVFDLGDDLRYKSYRNHTLRHMDDRIDLYNREKFTYNVKNIRL